MAFRFIHTADWQLGASFGTYGVDLAGQLKDARLTMIERIAEVAYNESAYHIVVAGDVWDSEMPSPQTLAQSIGIMADASTLTWWLLPGNHDPYRRNLLWDRVVEAAPSNVHSMLESSPIEVEPGVFFLPAPWDSKSPGRDLTDYMDSAKTPQGAIRIGIAHGGTIDFSGESGDRAVIAKDRAISSHLDYLALGDWHGVREVGEKTWYSGTPEADRFRRNEPGFCLVVEIDESNAVPKVTRQRIGAYDWRIIDLDLREGMDVPEALLGAFGDQVAERRTLIQLHLSGQLTMSDRLELLTALENLEARAAYLNVRWGDLTTLVSVSDLDFLDVGGSVRLAADELLARKGNGDLAADDRKIAGRALDLLFSLAADGGEAST